MRNSDGCWECAYTFGWRKRELLKLEARQVDLHARIVRLDPGTTKNNEGREVSMTSAVYALLAQCVQGKDPRDPVFTRANGKAVRDFRKAWYSLCIKADVGHMICRVCEKNVANSKCEHCGARDPKYVGLILHDSRRTAARNLRRAGVAEKVIMQIGGWKTRSVFERYNIVDQSDVREAFRKLEQHRAEAAADRDSTEEHVSHDSVMIGEKAGAQRPGNKAASIH